MTLVIKRHDSLPGEVLEVDLVPAFAFSEEKLLGLSRIGDALRERAGVIDSNFGVPNPHQRKVYAVPKKSARHNDFFWRLSFQEQEGGIIHDMGCIKPVIRLLKVSGSNFTRDNCLNVGSRPRNSGMRTRPSGRACTAMRSKPWP